MAKKATAKKATAKQPATKVQQPVVNNLGSDRIEYVLCLCYRLLREEGHATLVVSAMLNEISAGFSLADIEAAMKKFGDL